jgi:hypothetical protein
MSNREIAQFCREHLAAHPEAATSLNQIADRQEFAKAMVTAGAKAGFDFSEAEILAVVGGAGQSGDRELNDAQLEAVAGGCRKAGGEQLEYLKVQLDIIAI